MKPRYERSIVNHKSEKRSMSSEEWERERERERERTKGPAGSGVILHPHIDSEKQYHPPHNYSHSYHCQLQSVYSERNSSHLLLRKKAEKERKGEQ